MDLQRPEISVILFLKLVLFFDPCISFFFSLSDQHGSRSASPRCLCLVGFFCELPKRKEENKTENILSSQSESLISVWNMNKDCFSFFLFKHQASARYIVYCKKQGKKMKKKLQLQLTKQCPSNAFWFDFLRDLTQLWAISPPLCFFDVVQKLQPTCIFKVL